MPEELKEKLKRILETSADWSRIKTSVEGVFIMKLPGSERRPPSLAVEINPLLAGKPTKRRGLFLTSVRESEEFKRILSEPKVKELLTALEPIPTARKRKEEEVLEV